MDQSVHVTKPQPAAAAVAAPVAAVVSRRHHQSGYCEICESPFTDLYDHLSSRYQPSLTMESFPEGSNM
jgi:hypothetical protein